MTILGVLGEAGRLGDAERSLVLGTVAGGGRRHDPGLRRRVARRPPIARSRSPARPRPSAPTRSCSRRPRWPVPPTPRSAATTWRWRRRSSIPIVVQDHPASSGVQMTSDFLLALAAEAPAVPRRSSSRRSRRRRRPDGSSPARPTSSCWAASAARCCSRSCAAGSHGTMTGFGFPEVLVAVVRRWFAGDRDGRRGRLRPLRDAHPVREPGAAQPADPQARLPAARGDRPRDRAGARRAARPGHDRRPRRRAAAHGP